MNVRCPSCSRELLLPADVAGKMVKCPVCEVVFPAGEVGPSSLAADDAITPKRPNPEPPRLADAERVRARRDEDELDYPPPRRRPTDRYDDADDLPRRRRRHGYNYDDDYDYLAKKNRRDDMEEAESAVAAPAICLMCYGALYMLIGVGLAVAAFQRGVVSDERIVFMLFAMVILVQGGFIILGAVMMKTMRSWGFALAGGILPIITHPCNVIGIGVGVWVLDILNKRYVKRAFRQKAEGDFYDD